MKVFVDIDDTICYYKNKEDRMMISILLLRRESH